MLRKFSFGICRMALRLTLLLTAGLPGGDARLYSTYNSVVSLQLQHPITPSRGVICNVPLECQSNKHFCRLCNRYCSLTSSSCTCSAHKTAPHVCASRLKQGSGIFCEQIQSASVRSSHAEGNGDACLANCLPIGTAANRQHSQPDYVSSAAHSTHQSNCTRFTVKTARWLV